MRSVDISDRIDVSVLHKVTRRAECYTSTAKIPRALDERGQHGDSYLNTSTRCVGRSKKGRDQSLMCCTAY